MSSESTRRVGCLVCGVEILPATARRTGGFCRPCLQRKSVPLRGRRKEAFASAWTRVVAHPKVVALKRDAREHLRLHLRGLFLQDDADLAEALVIRGFDSDLATRLVSREDGSQQEAETAGPRAREVPELRRWLDTLLSELHRSRLRAAGFRKSGRTFSRERSGSTERFSIQGNRYNANGESPWRFFVNVGLELHGVPERQLWELLPKSHVATRLEDLVPKAPSEWSYDLSTDRDAFAELLGNAVLRACDLLGELESEIRGIYLERGICRLGRDVPLPP